MPSLLNLKTMLCMKGGKREGAGRKPSPYKTKMVRVPIPILDRVMRIIRAYKDKI